MASSIQTELETVYGQIVSFSLTNVKMPETLDETLIEQQVNKRNIETAEIIKRIQKIQGKIERIRKEIGRAHV